MRTKKCCGARWEESRRRRRRRLSIDSLTFLNKYINSHERFIVMLVPPPSLSTLVLVNRSRTSFSISFDVKTSSSFSWVLKVLQHCSYAYFSAVSRLARIPRYFSFLAVCDAFVSFRLSAVALMLQISHI